MVGSFEASSAKSPQDFAGGPGPREAWRAAGSADLEGLCLATLKLLKAIASDCKGF